MDTVLDTETLERFRAMSPQEAYDKARDAVYRLGGTNSADFLDVWEQLVDHGVLTWDQIEEFEGR